MKNTTIFKTSNSGKNLRFWHFCLVLYALFSVTAGQGQTGTVEIGSGTASNSYLMPAYTNYGYSYSQQIVKAGEYSASGGVAGNITKIRFYVGTLANPVANWNSWTVYLGHTSKNTFANTTDWEPLANLTQVFSGTITPVGSSWMEITFTTPFAYNGTSNLIVAVDENSSNWSTGDTYWGSYTGSTDTAIYYRNDTTNPNPATPPTATGRTNLLARIQFFGAVAPCLAPTGVNIPTVTTNGATIVWAASASAPASGYEYYYSTASTAPTSGTTPSGSVGAGVLTAPISGLTPNTPYYVWVRGNCGTDGVSAWTAVAGFTTLCDPQDIPYTQDFESVTTPALPACTSVQTISANAWATNSPAAYGFTNKALRFAYSTSAAANAWFFTKGLNLTAGTSYRIAYKYGSAGFNERMKVMYGTAPTAASMTLPLADHNGFTTSPLNNFVDFIPATSGVYYFGFNAYSVANQFWIFLDDISITVSPTCFVPTALTSAVVNTTSGTLSWTAPTPAPANGYEYYTSTTNTAPTAATAASGTVAAGVTTTNVGGLAPNTTNYFWVRSVCSGSDKSAWAGPTSFYTGYCTPAPSSVDGTGITNVTMGGVNNTTVAETGNYGNYSAMVANGTIGSAVNFNMTFNTCAGTNCYDYITYIWVDWNNDLDFADAGELVFTGTSTAAAPITLSGSFNIPANAALAGNHRMRIGATDSSTPTPCYAGTYGTYEDYTLNAVMPPAPVVTSFTPASFCAAVGDLIITGTDLNNASVTVGGTPVVVNVNTATQVVAVVPAGVSGVVAVTTVSGTFTTANTFTVTAPTAIMLSAASDTICVGQSTDAVTITAGASAFDTFEWSPMAGVSGNAASGYTFNPTATTTYTLTASNTVSGCVTTTTFTANVNVLPTALVLPDAASVCEGGSAVAVTATGGTTNATMLSENFNAATNSWTTANLGTGGTVANAAWTLRADGYTLPGYQLVHSNDNSQFYVSNSDQQGSGSTTSTVLQSPSFSTVAYASATLSFHHFYQHWATGSSGKVEASTDGTTWTTLQTYSATTGGYTAFAAANIPLTAPFLNQPVVYIRFKFDAVWGYFWAIDNVSVSGQQGADITWAPQTGLYTDAAATVAYTGQPAATVYAKPAATTTYTATATNPFGCSVTDTVEVTHISTPAPAADAAQSVCSGATVTALAATGTTIKWYAAATGGTQLAGTTSLANGTTYYASQTANGCESVLRTPVTVTVNVTAAPTVANDIQSFCNAGTVSQLVATGTNVQWYAVATGGTALAGTTAFAAGTTVYYASQTVNGCESTLRTAVAVVVNVTTAPAAAATQTFCNSGTVAGLVASGTGVQWYAGTTGGTALAGTTALTDGGVYYASQTVGGCESATRTMVTVDFTTPAAPDAAATQSFCNAATVADLEATGNIAWYAGATGGIALASSQALTNGGVYYASHSVDGCESATRTMVTVTLTTPAAPDAAATQTFCNGATVADLAATGTAGADITWYASATGGTALSSSAALANGGVYYASQTVVGCESATRAMVTVAFNATAAPVVTAALQSFCNSATVADLDADGQGIQWYASATGGNALAADASLTDGMLYYASQTIDGCEGMQRATVAVSITTVAALTGDAEQSVTAGVAGEVTLEDLMVDSYQGYVTWYASEEAALNGDPALPAGTQLVSGETYYGIQTVGNCSSETAFAVTVVVTLDGKHFDTASFRYFPNPVKDVLNVSYSSDITSVAVFNMLGQQVIALTPGAAETKVDMSGLADGTYVMKITAGEAVKSIKVMKKQ